MIQLKLNLRRYNADICEAYFGCVEQIFVSESTALPGLIESSQQTVNPYRYLRGLDMQREVRYSFELLSMLDLVTC